MKNTEHTPKRRMFIISFGDSRKYRVIIDNSGNKDALAPIVKTENELNAFLAKEFPGDTFAYYTTPRITEVNAEHEAKYAQYPVFDDKAVADVKKELVREIEVMNSDRRLNSNDPWGTGNVGISFSEQ
ncbi:MAG: hypothetical protein NC402_04000 [Prevotella sp.]|nr:hypothetical protein [Prevotella sp.]MCM1074856.1 hypothetical protein [Ruminococcus sp.]